MLLGGLQKTTYLDYPGKIACIVFTVGCNMKCRYCYNKQFVLPQEIPKAASTFIPEEDFFSFLNERKHVLDGVVVCGGEPTTHRDLPNFCKHIKDMGLLVKLDTNGTNPSMVQELIDQNLIDYVAMDIKDTFGDMKGLTGITATLQENIETTISLLASNTVKHEFRTTVCKPYHTPEKVEKIAQLVSSTHSDVNKPLYAIQNFFPTDNMIDPGFEAYKFSSYEMKQLQSVANQYLHTEIR